MIIRGLRRLYSRAGRLLGIEVASRKPQASIEDRLRAISCVDLQCVSFCLCLCACVGNNYGKSSVRCGFAYAFLMCVHKWKACGLLSKEWFKRDPIALT